MATSTTSRNEVVVGVDGSPTSFAALRWALDYAHRIGADVIAVHAWEHLFYGDVTGGATMVPPELLADSALAILDDAIARVDVPANVRVIPEVVEGSASKHLLDRSVGAQLLVVGARGRGGFLHLLLGSVASQCVNHATVPVVVVPSVDQAH